MHLLRAFRIPLRALLVAVLLVIISAPALANLPEVPGQDTEVPEGTTEDAFNMQAEMYAESVGIGVEEAKRRLELQGQVMELSKQLRERENDVFTDIAIFQHPDFHVVVYVVPGGEERIRPYFADGPLRDLVRFEMVEYSAEQLETDYLRGEEMLRSLGINSAGSISEYYSTLYVLDLDDVQRRLSEAGLVLPHTVRLVEVEFFPSDDGTVIGGFRVTTNYSNGTVGACTSAFAGRYDSGSFVQKGVFTAGHCGKLTTLPIRFQNISGVDFLLQNQFLGGSSDFQFHHHDYAHDLRSMINIGTTWIPITGLQWRSSMIKGVNVCVFGQATQVWNCGWIWKNTYDPQDNSTDYGQLITYSPTFIQVKNKHPDNANQDGSPEGSGIYLTQGGDSGGPWFGGTTATLNSAYGVHKGGWGRDAFFMAQDYLYSRGYRIYTNCPTSGGLTYNCK